MQNYVNIRFDFNQIMQIINQCTDTQKIEIIKELTKTTFEGRFKKLFDELKDFEITESEILKEVENERENRYKNIN